MSFSTRRGRPRKEREAADRGTPELCAKRELGLTTEPIDLCLNRRLITREQHWCGLHLRWLYTIRYGAPTLTSHWWKLLEEGHGSREDNPDWRAAREEEYAQARTLLAREGCYEAVMRIAVYNEMACFLRPDIMERVLRNPSLLARIGQEQKRFVEGLESLQHLWKKR